MSAQHTPGPWKAWQNTSEVGTNYWRFRTASEMYGLQDNLGGYCGEANARLIAAAPELLEALETLNLVIGLTPIAGNKDALQDACDIAREAIAKAKGGVK